MASLMIVGAVFLQIYNVFELINQYDVTKISFIILAMFLAFTVQIGALTYKPTRETYRKIRTADFFSEKFLMLGMIGTVIGFIYMLHTCFSGINVSNPASMQAVLVRMSVGMSTALFTTAAGLICGFLLKLQIFNLQQAIEESKNAT